MRIRDIVCRLSTIVGDAHDIVGGRRYRVPAADVAGEAVISWASLRYYHADPRYRARGTISRPANDIAHTHDIVSVRGDIRSRRTISRVTPTITRVGTISRRDHDIVGLCTISPRGPRHRKYPQYHSLSRDIGTGARYRRPPAISCASHDIANRPTKSRILTISRPPRQYRTNRGVVMEERDREESFLESEPTSTHGERHLPRMTRH